MTPWTEAHLSVWVSGFPDTQASLSVTNSQILLKLMSIESVMPSNHLILCRPLSLLPSVIPSIRVFFNESVLHIRWLKYWSFSFSISPSNEYSGLIFFRIDSFDLLTVQESWTPKFESISSSVFILLYHSALTFIHDYWENCSFDYTHLCWQSDVSAFKYAMELLRKPQKKNVTLSLPLVLIFLSYVSRIWKGNDFYCSLTARVVKEWKDRFC